MKFVLIFAFIAAAVMVVHGHGRHGWDSSSESGSISSNATHSSRELRRILWEKNQLQSAPGQGGQGGQGGHGGQGGQGDQGGQGGQGGQGNQEWVLRY